MGIGGTSTDSRALRASHSHVIHPSMLSRRTVDHSAHLSPPRSRWRPLHASLFVALERDALRREFEMAVNHPDSPVARDNRRAS